METKMDRRINTIAVAACLIAACAYGEMVDWTNSAAGTNPPVTIIDWATDGDMQPFGLIGSNHWDALRLATYERIRALLDAGDIDHLLWDLPSDMTNHSWVLTNGHIGYLEMVGTNSNRPLDFTNSWWRSLTRNIECCITNYVREFSATGIQYWTVEEMWATNCATTSGWTRIPARHSTNSTVVVGDPCVLDTLCYEWFSERYDVLNDLRYTSPIYDGSGSTFNVFSSVITNFYGEGISTASWSDAKGIVDTNFPGGSPTFLGDGLTYGKIEETVINPGETNEYVRQEWTAQATRAWVGVYVRGLWTGISHQADLYLLLTNVAVASNNVYSDQHDGFEVTENEWFTPGSGPVTNYGDYFDTNDSVYCGLSTVPDWCDEPETATTSVYTEAKGYEQSDSSGLIDWQFNFRDWTNN